MGAGWGGWGWGLIQACEARSREAKLTQGPQQLEAVKAGPKKVIRYLLVVEPVWLNGPASCLLHIAVQYHMWDMQVGGWAAYSSFSWVMVVMARGSMPSDVTRPLPFSHLQGHESSCQPVEPREVSQIRQLPRLL